MKKPSEEFLRLHKKFLKKHGILNLKLSKQKHKASLAQASSIITQDNRKDWCSSAFYLPSPDKSYILQHNLAIGQAFNKGGLQVLSQAELSDPATGKRRAP